MPDSHHIRPRIIIYWSLSFISFQYGQRPAIFETTLIIPWQQWPAALTSLNYTSKAVHLCATKTAIVKVMVSLVLQLPTNDQCHHNISSRPTISYLFCRQSIVEWTEYQSGEYKFSDSRRANCGWWKQKRQEKQATAQTANAFHIATIARAGAYIQ